ncbi:MAG: DUF1127 domain-containing protein [Rhodospirillaceae bacterium]|jgi:uncharacterized protein YjiS (DUF1127 family)|nr:DUF1127 domain-containing protein [Rhodospirillaceae bacterium]MBT6118302.1 DUF1127 domain-containing protein [Rhodospirillaceae bacterium]
MTFLHLDHAHGNPGIEAARTVGRAAKAVLARFETWAERSRQRAELANLDARTLHDIGLSRSDIAVEINKPFWRH